MFTLYEAIEKINKKISQNTLYLNQLDAAIGDGDFGSNVTNGFQLLMDNASLWKDLPLKEALLQCGKLFSFKIGGSSGQLFAISLIRIGDTLSQAKKIDNKILASALENAKNGIQKLGGAKPGEKTLIDAIIPAYEALRNSTLNDLDFRAAYDGAKKGALATSNMPAFRGRASYLGDRALGHMDAGSNAIVLIFEALMA
jgi:dihydroxyacetone kinase-like protein